jgi:hypothetical protein
MMSVRCQFSRDSIGRPGGDGMLGVSAPPLGVISRGQPPATDGEQPGLLNLRPGLLNCPYRPDARPRENLQL